ncbi:IS1 family transposase [Spirosoma sp. SC4-14]|uniref:IS1 family transposase n=1 Tax=Spirosoma sp. SC4-14 TaxID=3128900 RepID=UPI00403F293B
MRGTLLRWLWWVEDAVTGEIIAFVFGRRIFQTFRHLLHLLEAKLKCSNGYPTLSVGTPERAYFDFLDQCLLLVRKA